MMFRRLHVIITKSKEILDLWIWMYRKRKCDKVHVNSSVKMVKRQLNGEFHSHGPTLNTQVDSIPAKLFDSFKKQ